MNDVDLLGQMRAEVPLLPPSPRASDALAGAIAADRAGPERNPARVLALRGSGARGSGPRGFGPRGFGPRGFGPRSLIAGSIAAAIAIAAGAAGVAWHQDTSASPAGTNHSGRPAGSLPILGMPSVGRARTGAQLVAFATRAASLAPQRGPGPNQWIFIKTETADSTAGGGGFLFGPPNERHISVQWIESGWREYAQGGVFKASRPASAMVPRKIGYSRGGPPVSLGGWQSVSYGYLNSLPTDPAKLRSVILSQNKQLAPWYEPGPNMAVFSAIANLLVGQTEGVWLPPKLAATMYQLLRQTAGVHFDTAVDLAGRTGLGFYMVVDGWQKHELVINPSTYTYMGDEWVAVRSHQDVGTDGTRSISKGQVLGWEALLEEAIVSRAGQLP
jgi:hypothetical protein